MRALLERGFYGHAIAGAAVDAVVRSVDAGDAVVAVKYCDLKVVERAMRVDLLEDQIPP